MSDDDLFDDLANHISWSFGNCGSEYDYTYEYDYDLNMTITDETVYQNNRTYNQSCCFNTSPNNWVFPLVCENYRGDGWDDGYITIGGKQYCVDFPSGWSKINYVEANPS